MNTSRRQILGMGAGLLAATWLPGFARAGNAESIASTRHPLWVLRVGNAASESFCRGATALCGSTRVKTLDFENMVTSGWQSCLATLDALRGQRVVGLLAPHQHALLQELLRELGSAVWAEGHHRGATATQHQYTNLPRSEGASGHLNALLNTLPRHQGHDLTWASASGVVAAQIAQERELPGTTALTQIENQAFASLTLTTNASASISHGQHHVSFAAEL